MSDSGGHEPMTKYQIVEAVRKTSSLHTQEARDAYAAVGALPDLDDDRKDAAEWVYDNFRFDVAPEGASGWEWESGGNEFGRTVFLPNGDGDTVKGSFGIRFRPDTSDVADVWSFDQNGMENGTPRPDWYERRNELECGQVFKTFDDRTVQLDRPVPGDGTKWYVLSWFRGGWSCEDDTIEPGDLEDMIEDPEKAPSAEPESPAP